MSAKDTETNIPTCPVLYNLTDGEIIDYMKKSTDIHDWNNRREEVKVVRDSKWLIANIEQSGLINEVFPYKGDSMTKFKDAEN